MAKREKAEEGTHYSRAKRGGVGQTIDASLFAESNFAVYPSERERKRVTSQEGEG